MRNITKEYALLFNTITDTEETLRQLQQNLMKAQRLAEALFLEDEEPGSTSKPA